MSRNRYGNCRKLSAVLLVMVVVVLVLAPGTWAQSRYKTLHRFKDGPDGADPWGGLIFDQAGNLYGIDFGNGGQGLFGNVFKLRPNADGSWTEERLHNFTGGKDGADPGAGVIFDAAGNLYGTTVNGGDHWLSIGVVFELTPNANGGWTETVLHTFKGGDQGHPWAALIFDQAGNLYGTTIGGGSNGMVFKLKPNPDGGWTESVLHSFSGGADGAAPYGGVIIDQAGNLYGTTVGGGAHGAFGGVVFKLTPQPDGSWTESVLYNFTDGADGGAPFGGLIFDQSGNLYGTTAVGGNLSQCSGGCGVVFELTPNGNGGWKEQVLHAFAGSDGGSPEAALTFDGAGNLYGTTDRGGASTCGCGTVFRLSRNSKGGWDHSTLHSFYAHPGASPTAGVIFDAAGNLFSTTSGYPLTFGSVFEITP